MQMKNFYTLLIIVIVGFLFFSFFGCTLKFEIAPNEKPANISNLDDLSDMSRVIENKYYIPIALNLTMADYYRFRNDLTILAGTKIRDVNLQIYSYGGELHPAMAIVGLIKAAQNKNFKVTAHGSGIVASAAVAIFAACDVRLATMETLFMVHKPTGQENLATATATKAQINANKVQGKLITNCYEKVLAEHSLLKESVWKEKMKNITWFDVPKAISWGLLDRIK